MECSVCSKTTHLIARREELAWQREEMVHSREKELREWEIILEKKTQMLELKEKQFKEENDKFFKIRSGLSTPENKIRSGLVTPENKIRSGLVTPENGRKSSMSDTELCTVSFAVSDHMNESLLKKETLLLKKENVLIENTKHVETREHNILLKEQLFEKHKDAFNKEELVRQNNLDERERILKNNEDALNTQLMTLRDEIKLLKDRSVFLFSKEEALLELCEILDNRERDLEKREATIIEKENLYKKVNLIISADLTQNNSARTKDAIKEIEEIFNNKWESTFQRENAVKENELILQDKWKIYVEAKQLLKSEEESLLAKKESLDKERIMLREWEKLLGQKELGTNKLSEESVVIEDDSLFSMSGRESSNSSDICLKLLKINDKESSQIIVPSDNIEKSNTEFNQFFEKENDLMHKSLFKNNEQKLQEEIAQHSGCDSITEIVETFTASNISSKLDICSGSAEKLPEINTSNLRSSKPLITKVQNENNLQKNSCENHPTPPKEKSNACESSIKVSANLNKSCTSKEILLEKSFDNKPFETLEDKSSSENCENNSEEVAPLHKQLILVSNLSNNKIPTDIATENCANPHVVNMVAGELPENNTENKKCMEIQGNNTLNNENIETSDKSELQRKDGASCSLLNSYEQTSVDKLSSNASLSSKSLDSITESIRTSKENTSTLNSGAETAMNSPVCSPPLVSNKSTSSLTSIGWRQKKPGKFDLLEAINKGNILETVKLLETNSITLGVRDDKGRTAFLLAVEKGNIELVGRLKRKGANMMASDYSGNSALHIAVHGNDYDMVRFLLTLGLDPQVTNNEGHSALKVASDLKHSDLVSIMNKHVGKTSA